MARRVNTRFVLILAGSAVGVVLIGVVAMKLLIQPHPEQFVSAATDAESHHDWSGALEDWGKALKADPQNPMYFVRAGIDWHRLGEGNVELARKRNDIAAWNQALELQPDYVPAIRQLWVYWDQARSQDPNNVDALRSCRDYADQLLRVSPDAPDAEQIQASLYTTTIEGWLHGIATDMSQINDSETKMRALIAKDPANADLRYFLARTEAHRGQEVARTSDQHLQPQEATDLFRKSLADMQAGIASQPRNAEMYFDMAQLCSELGELDRSIGTDRPHYSEMVDEDLNKSLGLLTGSEPDFLKISVAAAKHANAEGDTAKAQRIVRNLLRQNPTDTKTVFMALDVITTIPDLRLQAIDTLEAALNAEGQETSVDVERFQLLNALTLLQINQLDDATTDEARNRIKDEIDKHLKLMSDSNFNQQVVYRDQAMLYAEEKQFIDVIRVLTLAMNSEQNSGAGDADLTWRLATAYSMVNEREQALDYCQKTVDLVPTFVQARERLVELLLDEHTDEARQRVSEQMDYLMRAAPDDPEVISLEIRHLDPSADHDQIKVLYARLPEETAQQCKSKALTALTALRDFTEAARLFQKAVDKNPTDVPTQVRLAEVLAISHRRTDAILAVEKALEVNPNDIDLEVLLKDFQGTPIAEVKKYQKELEEAQEKVEEAEADPATRLIDEGKQARKAGDDATAEKDFLAAGSRNPNNPEVWEQLFLLYNRTKQFDKLQPYLDKLAAANIDQAHGLLFEFEVAESKGDNDRMMAIGKQLVNDLPEFAKSYYYLGLAYEAAGQWLQAIDNFEAALQKKGTTGTYAEDTEAVDMLKEEVNCYYHMNRPDGALVALQEGRRRFPDDPYFKVTLIRHELNYGDPESAIGDLQTLISQNSNIPDLYLEMGEAQLEVAQSAQQSGDSGAATDAENAAKDALNKGLAEFPDDGRFYSQLSEVMRRLGDIDGAEHLLHDMDSRKAFHGHPDAQVLLARLYSLNNRPDKAEDALHVAFERSKYDPDLENLLCNQYIEDGKYDEAMNLLSAYNAGDPRVRRERVNVLVRAGRWPEAADAIQSLIDGHPSDATALAATLAELDLSMGRLDAAGSIASQMLSVDPKNASALAMRGRLKMLQKPPDDEGALADFSAAHQLNPDDVGVLADMAGVYAYRFNTDEQCRVLEEALHIQPYNVKLRCTLAQAYSDGQPPQLDLALKTVTDGANLPGAQNDPQLALTEADIYRKLGRAQDAANAITESLRQNPNDVGLIQQYFDLLYDAHEFSVLVEQTSRLISQHKNIWWAWSGRGRAEAAQGRRDEADRDLLQALAVADAQKDSQAAVSVVKLIASSLGTPRAIELLAPRRGASPEIDFLLIMLYHQNHQDNLAIQMMEPMLDPSLPLPPAERLSRLETAGLIYSSSDPPHAEKAYAVYKQLLAISPNDLTALNNLACLCADDFHPPRIEEGLTAIRKAIDVLTKSHTSEPMVLDTYGWLLILSGQTSQGMDQLREVVDQAQFPEVYYHLAEGYLRLNRPEDAQREITNALTAIA
ncbi:MAG TPA: tetratricopeptide repeat protein [Tepidisphaeraceae bacterium]|nr:tetratricopeptide repeat protein [Tepidisphaeraceae bacterium]